MLVDSSVWIPFLRGDRVVEVEILVQALSRSLPVWLAPPILQEVLQGADRPERFAKWDQILGELPLLVEPNPRVAAREAAQLYARCRWQGIKPRSANDCLIAIHAISNEIPLLHNDRDFELIARVEPRLIFLPSN